MNEELKTNNEGFMQAILIVGILIAIVVVSGVSYYILKMKGEAPVSTKTTSSQVRSISKSIDTKTIETELNATSIDSIDSDLKSLDSSASAF